MTGSPSDRDVDAAFARFCSTGNAADLATVFDTLAGPLRAEARSLLGDPNLADDLVQMTFVAAIELQSAFDPSRGTAHGWLRGLLRNRARHLVRDRRTARESGARESSEELLDGRANPVEYAANRELAGQVRAAVDALPEPYRAAVQRVIVHGHSAEHVAAETGRPAATVRSHVHRGLARLRRSLPTVVAALARAMSAHRVPVAATALLAVAGTIALRAELFGSGPAADGVRPAVSPERTGVATLSADPQRPKEPGRELARRPVALGGPGAEPATGRAPARDDGLRLVRAVDDTPLPETLVEWRPLGGGPSITLRSDAAGMLRLPRTPDDGDRLLLPWAGLDLDFPRDLPAAGEVAIPPGFAVRGRVLDAQGRPAPFAVVLWTDAAEPDAASEIHAAIELTRCDEHGEFVHRDLTPSRSHALCAVTESFRQSQLAEQTIGGIATTTSVHGNTGAWIDCTLRVQQPGRASSSTSTAAPVATEPRTTQWLECSVDRSFALADWTLALLAAGDDVVLWRGSMQPSGGTWIDDPPPRAAHAVLLPPSAGVPDLGSRPLTRRASSRRVALERTPARWLARFTSRDLPVHEFRLRGAEQATRIVLLDASGRPGWIGRSDAERIGPVPPGSWTLAAQRRDGLWQHIGPLATRSEVTDAFVPDSLGTTELSFDPPPGLAAELVQITVCAGGAPLARQPKLPTTSTIDLVPGAYRVFWSAPNCAASRLDLDLQPGARRVQLDPAPGIRTEVTARFAAHCAPRDGIASLDLQLRDAAAGRLIWRGRSTVPLELRGEQHVASVTVVLPSGGGGAYRLDVTDRRGAAGTVTLRATDRTGSGLRVPVVLDTARDARRR